MAHHRASEADLKSAAKRRLGWLPDVLCFLLPRVLVDAIAQFAADGTVEESESRTAQNSDPSGLPVGATSLNLSTSVEVVGSESAFADETETVAAGGTTFDIDDIIAEADLATVPVSTPMPSLSSDVLTKQSDDDPDELGGAIVDATRHWDDQHQPAVPEPAPAPASYSKVCLTRLHPLQLIEGTLLLVLKAPLAALGKLVAISEVGVAKIADRVGVNALSIAFSIAAAVAVANLVILGIEVWASDSALRYPGWQASRGVRSFPFVGECAPMEYWFMTIDLAGVLAIVTFVYARKIEFCGDQ